LPAGFEKMLISSSFAASSCVHLGEKAEQLKSAPAFISSPFKWYTSPIPTNHDAVSHFPPKKSVLQKQVPENVNMSGPLRYWLEDKPSEMALLLGFYLNFLGHTVDMEDILHHMICIKPCKKW